MDWIGEYNNYIKEGLKIKIHPLFMTDLDSAKKEYERLCGILCPIYEGISQKDGVVVANQFLNGVNAEYMTLIPDVMDFHDFEIRELCAEDSSYLKNFVATLRRAKRIEVLWDESDGVYFRILEIKVIDSTNNVDVLSWCDGLNQGVLDEVVERFDKMYSKLTPSHKQWGTVKSIIESAVSKRIYSAKGLNRQLAEKCKPLYSLLLENADFISKNLRPSDAAVGCLIALLKLRISESRLKELIQGKK